MANAFLYFFPGMGAVADSDLAAAGLEVAPFSFGLIGAGPTGGSGCLVSYGDQSLRYIPDDQTWQRMREGLWIGYASGQKPGPLDLLRTDARGRSYPLALSDGREWMLPTVAALPSYWRPDETRNPERVVCAEYKGLQEKADLVFRCWQSERGLIGERVTMPDADGYKTALAALGLNYHISQWEAAALEIMTDADISLILGCLIDAPNHPEFFAVASADEVKKNESSACG